MPRKPGTRVEQEVIDTDLQVQEAELPTCVIGPLYQVVEDEQAQDSFDPVVEVNQEYEWPNKKTDGVVDLTGTRNGLIDSQRKHQAEFIPTFRLVDGQTRHDVDDMHVEGLSQEGFEIQQEARDGLRRAEVSGFVVSLDGEEFIYNPDGGFYDLEVGDRFEITDQYTIESRGATRVFVEEDLSGDVTPYDHEFETSDTENFDVVPHSSLPGRVVVEGAIDAFVDVSVDDFVATHVPMSGLTSMDGELTSDTEATDVDFGVSVSFEDLEDRVVRVENGPDTHFVGVTAVNSSDGTMTFDEPVGASTDTITITVTGAQKGFVEQKSNDDDELVVVVPETFSSANTAVYVKEKDNQPTFEVYPVFDVEVSYRALRKEPAGQIFTGQTEDEIREAVDHEHIHHQDGLAFAANIVANAQPEDRRLFFIPVDTEPTGSTGLPQNQDLEAGYAEAIESSESDDRLYSIFTLDKTSSVDSNLESNVETLSDEDDNAWRRGLFFEPVPKGDFESVSGTIAPGKASGGIVNEDDEGNSVIRDADIDFVNEAEVEAGTKVVVTFPEEFEGEYDASANTTDDDLILEGDDWEIVREFEVPTGMEVTTSGGVHDFTGADPDQFVHVEEGDYVEATIDGTTYRMEIVSVLADGTGFTAEDEAPGSPSWTDEPATDVAIIRTWRTVDYHIRPLSKDEQADELVARKSLVDRRYTLTLDYAPTIEVGVDEDGNPVRKELSPAITLAAIAAKRSGSSSYEEVSNLFLGAGIESVRYGYNHFNGRQKRKLSDAGFTLVEQETADSQPYIRDMITTDTEGIAVQEEIVTANVDWQSKTIKNTFGASPGERFANITDRLLGIRSIQAYALLTSWVDSGRLITFENLEVERAEDNPRQTSVSYIGTFPVGEKEIKFTIQIQV